MAWSHMSTSQGPLRMAGTTRSEEEARKDFSLESSKGASPFQHIDFRLVVFRAVRE